MKAEAFRDDLAARVNGSGLIGWCGRRIAAMAAKRVQPAPEPVLSLGGEQGTAAEFAQALRLVRAMNAPAVKETPRGLMTVAAMDHRLGRWNEA